MKFGTEDLGTIVEYRGEPWRLAEIIVAMRYGRPEIYVAIEREREMFSGKERRVVGEEGVHKLTTPSGNIPPGKWSDSITFGGPI
jgi:hypothetical protein